MGSKLCWAPLTKILDPRLQHQCPSLDQDPSASADQKCLWQKAATRFSDSLPDPPSALLAKTSFIPGNERPKIHSSFWIRSRLPIPVSAWSLLAASSEAEIDPGDGRARAGGGGVIAADPGFWSRGWCSGVLIPREGP